MLSATAMQFWVHLGYPILPWGRGGFKKNETYANTYGLQQFFDV